MKYVLKRKRRSKRGMRFVQAMVDPNSVLRELKLRAPERPQVEQGGFIDPVLPPDITKLSDLQLGQLYGEFCAMAQYVGPRAAIKAMATASARRTDKIIRARSHLKQTGTVGDKAAQVEVDADVLQSSYALAVAENEEVLVQAMLETYVIGREALSRELTRRQKVELPNTRR